MPYLPVKNDSEGESQGSDTKRLWVWYLAAPLTCRGSLDLCFLIWKLVVVIPVLVLGVEITDTKDLTHNRMIVNVFYQKTL